ncbi:MAG: NADP-dependent malic enzyme [Spirochaetales bacterium]|nr:NADP-dependent malic enzyme [Spirochaetales bacterium]
MQTIPMAGVFGFNWFNVWYTPGVSGVSTAIRDDNDTSFELTGRGNHVAVVSDSTCVLGDGDCTPPGGLGVMEGKAFLMKYLGGLEATALCIDSRNKDGEHDPEKIIDFVSMVEPSFGAINLEDISQPNCYTVLDRLKERCSIPVWHDDAEGTACVTLGALFNALKLAGKAMNSMRAVFIGAGASNTAIARIICEAGADPGRIIMFDSQGALHKKRDDLKTDSPDDRKWELCNKTNPSCVTDIEKAMTGADVLIALSRPGPDIVKRDWIGRMNERPIVFACANPVPEIYPYAAKEAGAFIVATGRGDFPNQVNNALGFPGILKGALLIRATKISDRMVIAAANSLATFAEKRGIHPENIIAAMDETDVFPHEAADVAMSAVEDGLARISKSRDEIYERAKKDILLAQDTVHLLIKKGFIKRPPQAMLQEAFEYAMKQVSG